MKCPECKNDMRQGWDEWQMCYHWYGKHGVAYWYNQEANFYEATFGVENPITIPIRSPLTFEQIEALLLLH